MIFKGFKFGMLLQLAIGPVCIFIFREGCNRGFLSAEAGVLAVGLTDAFYVWLAIQGVAKLLEDKRTQKILTLLGAAIVGIFGLNIIGDAVGMTIIPNFNLFHGVKAENTFLSGLILTVSNPLTVLFWAGVFSAKIAEERMQRKDTYLFGLGAVAATPLFLTFIALTGTFTQHFLPVRIIRLLNFLVGLALFVFAIKMVSKTVKKPSRFSV